MDPTDNYANYRRVPVKPPGIPYLAVTLRDLTFASENPSFLDIERKVVNFSKMLIMGRCVNGLIPLQQKGYDFEKKLGIYNFLTKLKILDQDSLYKRSLMCEPRSHSSR